MQEGRFRGDLYYRLNVITLELPPLRERLEDIPLLVRHLMTRICNRQGRFAPRIHPDVLLILKQYSWPGNVRQLENVVKRLGLTARTSTISLAEVEQVLKDQPAMNLA